MISEVVKHYSHPGIFKAEDTFHKYIEWEEY